MTGAIVSPGTELPRRLLERIEREAGAERLLWAGRRGVFGAVLQTIPVVLFGIPWTAFAVFWTLMAAGLTGTLGTAPRLRDGPFDLVRWVFPLFGLPFVAIGLGLLTSPFWAWRRALHTGYAVTDRRVIILTPSTWGAVTIQSFGTGEILSLTREERGDGSGNLVFGLRSFDPEAMRGRRTAPPGFYGVAGVRQVEALVRRAVMR